MTVPRFVSVLGLAACAALPLGAKPSPEKIANTVILDETGTKNLRIEMVEVEETTFEETVFALGRIRAAPGRSGIVSSRVSGRVVSVAAHIDTPIKEDVEALVMEVRQPGNPPPVLSLLSPLAGLVTKVNVVVGQPVSPDDSLVEITDLSVVHAVAAVPEHLVGKLKVGQTAQIRTQAYPDKTFTATLAHLGAEAEQGGGTLEAAFHVENKDLALRPGMRAEFAIAISKREGVLAVPKAALLGEPSRRFVYVADDELKHAYVKTPVVVGAQNDRFAEILDGLFPGDKVVVRGGYSLSFAGGGSVSLKEALDAAHGHEHAADGSELTPEKKAAMEAAKKGAHGHDHGEEEGVNVWMIVSGVLFVLLMVSSLRSFSRNEAQTAPAPKETA